MSSASKLTDSGLLEGGVLVFDILNASSLKRTCVQMGINRNPVRHGGVPLSRKQPCQHSDESLSLVGCPVTTESVAKIKRDGKEQHCDSLVSGGQENGYYQQQCRNAQDNLQCSRV
jgi:hypothetical protein